MQSGGGQYGVPGMQQFMVEGCTPHGFFAALSSPPPPQDGINQHHGNNHHPHLQQQQQQIHLQQSFQNQRVQHLQQQQQLGGLQAPAEESTRDLNGKRNKAFGLREGGGGNSGDSIQGVQDHPHPVAPPPPSSHVVSQQQQNQAVLTDDDGEGERSGGGGGVNRWPREETLALLRIRSQMDSNFRDSNIKGPLWENVSRKLAELGYQRSAKKCKEKFENINKYYKKTKDGRMGRQDGKSYRFYSELEALSARNGGAQGEDHHHHHRHQHQQPQQHQSIMNMAETSNAGLNLSSDNNTSEDEYNERTPQQQMGRKKRKRKQYLSSMALFFESLVKQLMEHQEELHRKFLEAIERRDQERLNREEAWRRQEMARLTRETELREQEHALASSREAALVSFLQKITGEDLKLPTVVPLNSVREDQGGPSYETMQEQQEREGMSDPCIGKRWPKPEVHALIRLRSGMEGRFQEPGVKGPLWEEISSGMAAQGFHRSAKRCKEKWENINKYFRKTKDSMKKRPENAKTCPYFHELGVLYGKGVLTSSSSAKPNNKLGNPSDVLMIDQGGEGEEDDNNDNNNGEDEEQAQGRSESEVLAMIPAEQTGIKNNGTNDDHQFFQDDHRVDQSQKRMKINNNNNQGLSFEGGEKLQNPDEQKKGNKMERLVKELLEMQQQKFLDDFERREHRQDRQQSGQEERQRQGGETQEEPQSALMALVHKFAVHAPEFDTQ